MHTTQLKYQPKLITFGKQSRGTADNPFDAKSLAESTKFKGRHPACRNCSGCGKGNACPIL